MGKASNQVELSTRPRNKSELRMSERDLYDRVRRDIKRDRAGVSGGWFACGLALLGIFTIGGIFVPLATIVCFLAFISALLVLNIKGILINLFAVILIIVGFVVSPSAWIVAAAIIARLAHS